MKREDWAPEIDTTPLAGEGSAEHITWPELEWLLESVADWSGVSANLVKGRGQTKRVVTIRREFCKRARGLGYSCREIGSFLGRDAKGVWTLTQEKKS